MGVRGGSSLFGRGKTHARKKKRRKSPDSSWIFLYDYGENNRVGGTERFEERGEERLLRDLERRFHTSLWNPGRKNQTMRAAVRRRIDQESRVR